MARISPVIIQQVDVKTDDKRRIPMVEVSLRSTGDRLAYCMIGDDASIERIADILSAKRLPEEAMRLRQMAMDARKVKTKR